MIATPMYTNGVAITKSDTVNFDGTTYAATARAIPAQGIYVGGAGNVVVVLANGTTLTITAVAGEIIPIQAIRVNSTNTTASAMVALYL